MFAEKDPSLIGKSYDELVKTTSGGVFNNAAQVWNHTFYWKSMAPAAVGGGSPPPDVAQELTKHFGSFEKFKESFSASAAAHFGSGCTEERCFFFFTKRKGWVWLVRNADGSLSIVDTHDADCPLRHNQTPILTCDVWEHACDFFFSIVFFFDFFSQDYIDYRNLRPDYIKAFWNLVNWDFVRENLKK